MKIAVCSDVHLEFGPIELRNTENADTLILSGDIMLGAQPEVEFLKQCSEEFHNVVYVAGNHEFYHGKWNDTLRILSDVCGEFSNIHFMENKSKLIGDTLFVGCTLWTDMNKRDPQTMHQIMNYLNDFRQITFDTPGFYRKLKSQDVVDRHQKSLDYLRSTIDNAVTGQKIVVVGHHAPSKASTHPRYAADFIVNGAYSSELSEFILDRPQIKLWTHGHTHERFDYMIGSTRIVANPRGYINYESIANSFELKYVEV